MALPVFLATGSYDRSIIFWGVKPVEKIRTFNFAQEFQVNCLSVSSDRTRLAAAGYTAIKVYDLSGLNSDAPSSAQNVAPIVSQLPDAHSANITAIGFVKFAPGAYMVYSVGEDCQCKLWETRSQQLRQRRAFEIKEPINTATLLHNSMIVCGTQLGTIGVWSFNVGPEVPTRNPDGLIDQVTYLNDDPAIRSLALTPGGDVLVAGTNSGRVLVFAISKSAMPNRSTASAANPASAASAPPGAAVEEDSVDPSVAASATTMSPAPGAMFPATIDAVPNVSMHTVDSATMPNSTAKQLLHPGCGVLRLVWTFEAHPRYILKCAISPNGAVLCTTSADTTVSLWKVPEELPVLADEALPTAAPRNDKWQLQRTLTGHQRWVWDCAFSHCSSYVVTASSDHTGRLWHVETGKLEATFAGHQKPVTCIVLDDRRE